MKPYAPDTEAAGPAGTRVSGSHQPPNFLTVRRNTAAELCNSAF